MDEYKVFEDIKIELHFRCVHDVAESACVSPSTLRNWMEGRTRTPRIDTLYRVARAMGFSIVLKRNSLRAVA